MTPSPFSHRPPVVLQQQHRGKRRARILEGGAARPDIPAPGALEAPLPGNLLVLLSRLHRAEAAPLREAGET